MLNTVRDRGPSAPARLCRRTRALAIGAALALAPVALWTPGCRRAAGPPPKPAPASAGADAGAPTRETPALLGERRILVGALEVRDISSTGSRLKGLATLARAAFQDPKADLHVALHPDLDAVLRLDLANICSRQRCYLSGEAQLNIPDEDGLRRRLRLVRMAPMEGIDSRPALRQLRGRVLRPLRAWLEALRLPPERLRAWLGAGDETRQEAALQAMIDRDLAPLGDALAPLLASPHKSIRMRAIAASGVLGGETVAPGLERIAAGSERDEAMAALRALADLEIPAARAAIGRLAKSAALVSVRDRARELGK